MRDDLSGLLALALVAEKRSFTAAAREMRVTPSAVSQQLRALEERVGVRLVQRTTRSVGLTEAGARFVAKLTPALDGVRDAFASLGELRDRPAGVLRLNVPRIGWDEVLAPCFAEFLAQNPDVRLDVRVDDGFVDIVEQGFDAGIRIGEMVARDMTALRVSDDLRVAVVASPAYLAARGRPKHPRELVAHDCINYRGIARGEIYRWEFTERGRDFEIAVDGRVVANDVAVMLRAAEEGLGLAYVFESVVERAIAAKRLVRVLDAFCAPFPGYFLYYPSRALAAPKLGALVDFFKARRRRPRRA